MKFTDGAWMVRKGFQPTYAAEAYEATTDGQSVKMIVPTRAIRHRGDTLQGPNLTISLSSPALDVVKVKIVHFEGVCDRGPNFEILQADGSAESSVNAETVLLTSGNLTARVRRNGYRLEFVADGKTITRSDYRATGYVLGADGQSFIHEQLSLGVGEYVYGLGERFTAFIKNGQTVDIWNEDGGTDCEQAYKNIPFYLTNRGYGVFVAHTGKVSFEVASEKASRIQFSVPGESLEYYVVYGPSPKQILEKYTALTGRPALPPAWSFGLWLTTSFTTNYDEKTVTSFISGMEERDLPLHVFHFDCFWMKGFHWSDLQWDPDVFPDPEGMLRRLKERGLRISAWINPYIAQASSMFAEGAANGYLLKRPNGDVWQWDMWQPGMAIVDFTNPEACRWFSDKLAALIDMGVDSLKTDFGERIPTDVVYFDGSDPVRMHNYYTQLYNQCVFKLLEEKKGAGEAVLFARSATTGGQLFPVHWGGDCWSEFEAMAASLRGGLSLGLSGFAFWSHDIGGFEGLPPAALYKRWVGFGLLSSHSRLHGSSSYRVPWLYDDEAVDTVRFFTKLKCRLMPYLYQAAVEATQTGVPMMRSMMLEFPEDPTCALLDRQYMLGESLLVAPVFQEDSEVKYYVPAGTWTCFFTGRKIVGPTWVKETHGFLSIPLLVREGSVIPVGANDRQPDYDYGSGVEFRVFQPTEDWSRTVVIPDVKGRPVGKAAFGWRDGELVTEVEGAISHWTATLV